MLPNLEYLVSVGIRNPLTNSNALPKYSRKFKTPKITVEMLEAKYPLPGVILLIPIFVGSTATYQFAVGIFIFKSILLSFAVPTKELYLHLAIFKANYGCNWRKNNNAYARVFNISKLDEKPLGLGKEIDCISMKFPVRTYSFIYSLSTFNVRNSL